MKNSFFKEMAMIGPGFQVSMTIKETHGKLIVTVLPVGLDNVVPIIASGTPDELDEGFFEQLRKPLIEAHGIVVHNAEYKASLKKAKKEPVKAEAKQTAPKTEDQKEEEESEEEEEAESEESTKASKVSKAPKKEKATNSPTPAPETAKPEGAKPVSLF